jgi:hypothetical protein
VYKISEIKVLQTARTIHGCSTILFYLLFFIYLVCEAIGTAATTGLLCQPWVIVKMIVEKQMECRLAGETEVLSITKSHMPRPGFEPEPPQ